MSVGLSIRNRNTLDVPSLISRIILANFNEPLPTVETNNNSLKSSTYEQLRTHPVPIINHTSITLPCLVEGLLYSTVLNWFALFTRFIYCVNSV